MLEVMQPAYHEMSQELACDITHLTTMSDAESAPAFGIRVKNTTQGRSGNRVEGTHFDGSPLNTIHDPHGAAFSRCFDG